MATNSGIVLLEIVNISISTSTPGRDVKIKRKIIILQNTSSVVRNRRGKK